MPDALNRGTPRGSIRLQRGLVAAGFLLSGAAAWAATAIPVATISRSAPVAFETEILPMLRDNCQACHNAAKPKAGLALETPAQLLKGGESGPAVVPGKGEESLLVKVAAHLADPVMPPSENKVGAKNFTSEQLGLLKLWIDQGATGMVSAARPPLQWRPLPATLVAINTVALTEDGRFAACGRGNQIDLYDLALGLPVGRLTGPADAMHRDVVQSLAFDPAGGRLASGGYRSINLWRREPLAPAETWNIPAEVRVAAISADRQTLAFGFAERGVELWNATGQKLREIAPSSGSIRTLTFSPDGTQLAGILEGKAIEVWAAPEWRSAFKAEFQASAVGWLPGGKGLAAGGTNGVIHIWDFPLAATNAAPVRELTGHTGAIRSLEPHPSKPVLLSASADGSVRFWDTEKWEQVRQFDHGSPVTVATFRPDGQRIASLGNGGAGKLWEAESGKLVAEFKGDRRGQDDLARASRTLAFAKAEIGYHQSTVDAAQKQHATDGEASKKANEAKTAADAEVAAKDAIAKQATQARDAAKGQLAAADGGLKLATQNKDAAAKLAELAAGQLQTARDTATQSQFVLGTLQPAKDAAYQRLLDAAAEAKAAPDQAEKRAAAERASEDFGQAKSRLEAATAARAAAERAVKELEALAPQNAETKTASEKALAEAATRQKESSETAQKTEKEFAEADKVLQKARTDQGKAKDNAEFAARIAQKSEEVLKTARAASQAAAEALTLAENRRAAAAKVEEEKRPNFRVVAFSPDNRLLLTSAEGGDLQIWNADSGQPLENVAAEPAAALLFLAPSRFIAVGAKASLWDSQPVWRFERSIGREDGQSPIEDRVLALAFSGDGKILASGGGQPTRSGEIKLWNPADGSLIRGFTDPHSDTVYALAFSFDQKWLASGGADKFAKVFDIETGKLVRAFEGHTHHVLGVSWKRDGRTLASAGADKVVKIWNTQTGEQRKTIDGFGKEVTSVQFLDASSEALVSTGEAQLRLIRDDGNNNMRTFEGAAGFLSSAAATPDGQRIIAGNQEGLLRVWDGATGKPIRAFEPPVATEKLAQTSQ